jgi:hypothetical protein
VEGEVCGDGFWPEGTCVFLFVHELDSSYSEAVIVEEKRIWVIDGVTDLDALTDIGGGDLVDGALEADGGIVIDDAFVADKEDLVELCLGKSPDGDSGDGCIVAVNGPLTDAGVDLVMVVVPEPEPEGLIELMDGDPVLYPREEAFPDGPKIAFHLAAGGAVIGFGVDKGDATHGAASGKQVGGETWAIVHIEALGDAVGEEGLLEDERENADGLGRGEGMAHQHAGVIIEDGAKDGFSRAFLVSGDLRAVHEVADPELVYVIHLVGLSLIGAVFEIEPALLFDHPEKRVVVDGGLTQKALGLKVFIEFLDGEKGIGLALDLDGLEGIFIQTFWPSHVGAPLGLEGVKTLFAVSPEPTLQGGDAEFFQTVAREVVLELGLCSEVVVLGPFGLGQDR